MYPWDHGDVLGLDGGDAGQALGALGLVVEEVVDLLRKVGFRSRAQVAAWAAQRGLDA